MSEPVLTESPELPKDVATSPDSQPNGSVDMADPNPAPTNTSTAPDPVAEVPAPAAAKPEESSKIPIYRPSYLFLGGVAVVSLVADLWTKAWAVRTLELNGMRLPPKEIIKGWVNFTLARNPGGAWGMLHDKPEKIRVPFFVTVSLIAVVIIVMMFRNLERKQWALKWGLPLVLGGALGNLVDRIRYSQVVDFIDVIYWKSKGLDKHWPTFNVADIAICIGVILMAIDFLFPHSKPVKLSEKKTTKPVENGA